MTTTKESTKLFERRCLDCNQNGLSPVTATNHRNRGHRVFWANIETGELYERKPGSGNRYGGSKSDSIGHDGNGHDESMSPEDVINVRSRNTTLLSKVRATVKDSTTVTPEELSNVVFTKKSVEVVLPQIILVAKEACEKEWGWPVMNMSDWLATFCYIMMKKKGIVLGHYSVIEGSNHG